MKFRDITRGSYERACVALALVCSVFTLCMLRNYSGMKGFTNYHPIIDSLDMNPKEDQLILPWPDDSPVPSEIRGTKQPLYSTPEDPHLCLLVSTYKPHSVKLITLLTSFFSSGYPYLKAILLDTDEVIDSTPWMKDMAKVVNEIFDKEFVVTANITQRDVLRKYSVDETGVSSDYGYILSDEVISDLMKKRDLARELNDSKLECDYFMVTNGDNLYGPGMVSALLHYLRQDYDIVGFDFISRYKACPLQGSDMDRVFKPFKEDQQVGCEPIRKVHGKKKKSHHTRLLNLYPLAPGIRDCFILKFRIIYSFCLYFLLASFCAHLL